MKEAIPIHLEKEILKKIDELVEKEKVVNRSNVIEHLLRKAMGISVPTKAVILAGGKGTRLRPITHEIPKPLMPIHGKPIVEHLFDLFKKYDIKDITLTVGYKKDRIKQYLSNGEHLGININYIEEESAQGTAGAIKSLKGIFNSSFIVTNGDELKDVDLEAFYNLHKRNNALITIGLTEVPDPSAYGVAKMDGDRIAEFVEKPKIEDAPSKLISSGIYILEPEIIDLIPEGFAMFETDIFPKVASMGRLFGYHFPGLWFDTGTLERYEQAIQKWQDLKRRT